MAEDNLSKEMENFLQKLDTSKLPKEEAEKSVKDVCMETARTQLESLGYSEQLQQMVDHYGTGGTAREDYGMFGNTDDVIRNLPNTMKRVAPEEARQLLTAACFGMPIETSEDGTVLVTSLTISVPTATTIQTKFPMSGDKKSDKHYMPDKPATDGFVKKFISDTGFVEQGQADEAIQRLKRGEKISFQHPSNRFLTMTITGPEVPKRSRATDLYSYQVQTKLTPRPNQLPTQELS